MITHKVVVRSKHTIAYLTAAGQDSAGSCRIDCSLQGSRVSIPIFCIVLLKYIQISSLSSFGADYMFDSHPKVFDCVCKIVPTKKTCHNPAGWIRTPMYVFFCLCWFPGVARYQDPASSRSRGAGHEQHLSLSRDPLFWVRFFIPVRFALQTS